MVNGLSDTDLALLLARFVQGTPSVRESRGVLVRLWASSRPASAAAWAWGLPASQGVGEGGDAGELLNQVLVAWSNNNLPEAVAWAGQLPESDSRKDVVRTAIAYEAARTSPKTAVTLAMEVAPCPESDRLLEHSARQWASSHPREAVEWARQVTDTAERQRLLAAIAVEWAAQDPVQAGRLAIESLRQGRLQEDAVVSIAQRWAQQDPQAAAAWVARFPAGNLKQTAAENVAAIGALHETANSPGDL